MTITTRLLMGVAYAGVGALAIFGHLRHGDIVHAASSRPLICIQTLKAGPSVL